MQNRTDDQPISIPRPDSPIGGNGYYAPPPPVERGIPLRPRRPRRARSTDWAWFVIAGALFGVVLIVSLSLVAVLRATSEGIEVIPTQVVQLPTPVDARTDLTGSSGGSTSGQQVTFANGTQVALQPYRGGRMTILVMGLDRRPGETGLSYRTDTMLVVSIDPVGNQLGILSIPRDLYVEVPGYGQLQRINSAMVLGELQQTGYGPSLAMQTVQLNLGIRIHAYMAVDFNAFITLIDVLGGIDVDVEHDIIDYEYPDMNYGYDPLIIRAGLQHFDGETALKYSRTRHGDNDFERARRQQQVLFAIRDRVLDADAIPQLIAQAPSLWASFNQNVYTELSLERLIQLGLALKDIPVENIRTGVIDGNYIMPYTTSQGASVLVPRREAMGGLMAQIFGENFDD
jgi:polyisoprenyl-teichoic acid--peptidoglycan teichoic acid transferase